MATSGIILSQNSMYKYDNDIAIKDKKQNK